jgi:hypothetical protein
VVLFPPFGHEALWCHRALRELALRLAGRGHAVLRFDWRGTGDSLGESGEFGFDDWLADGRAARDWLTARFPEPIAIGLRLGATLAALDGGAAGRRIALWQPVAQGAGYLAALRALQAAHAAEWGWTWVESPGLEVLGCELSPAHQAALSNLSPAQLAAALEGADCLHLINAEDGEQQALAAQLAGPGRRTCVVAEARLWDTEPYRTFLPQGSLEALVRWVTGRQDAP